MQKKITLALAIGSVAAAVTASALITMPVQSMTSSGSKAVQAIAHYKISTEKTAKAKRFSTELQSLHQKVKIAGKAVEKSPASAIVASATEVMLPKAFVHEVYHAIVRMDRSMHRLEVQAHANRFRSAIQTAALVNMFHLDRAQCQANKGCWSHYQGELKHEMTMMKQAQMHEDSHAMPGIAMPAPHKNTGEIKHG